MHKKTLFGLLILVLIVLPLFIACPAETTPTPTTSTPKPTEPAPTQTAEVHWWDELGEPQYGGEINFRVASLTAVFDIYTFDPGSISMCFVSIFKPDRTVDPETWSFNSAFVPMEYVTGHLIESWETPDPNTVIYHVNQDVHWQNKEPLNGRAFTAYDLEYYFHRNQGLGHGYTEPIRPDQKGIVTSVEVLDDYTLKINLGKTGYGALSNLIAYGPTQRVDPEEVLEAEEGGFLSDWHKVVSVGPWILTDFATGSYAVYDKDPNYWDYDERYPENQLPYADKLTLQCIPDISTAMAAMRTGKIDFMESVLLTQSQTLAESNPELVQHAMPAGALALSMRCDMEPFSDIRVRKALQMSVNREEIVTAYYKGMAEANPAGLVDPSLKGVCYPYDEWPQSLKDEYSYNPDGARALLAEAGYAGGFECTMWMDSREDLALGQVMKAYLLDIGVDATIEVTDTVTLNAMINQRQYDGTLFGVGTGNMALTLFTKRFACADPNLNLSVVCDPAFDALFEDYLFAANEKDAIAVVAEMDKLSIENHWQITTPCINNYNIHQPYLKGYNGEGINGNSMGGYYHARWWIDQELKETLR